jgi:SPP1 family predicted phage head-tail adaptor
MTAAGDLNHRIRIERQVKTENTRGEVVYTWALHATVWAQVSPMNATRGRELVAASQVQSEITTRFRIRYREGIDETMRIIWRGVQYDIKAPPGEVQGGRTWVDLMAKAGVVAEGR